MATQDYLSNYTQAPGKKSALAGQGVREHYFQTTISILAADDNNSTYLIMKDLPANAVIRKLEIERDDITGGTDYDIGLYNPKTGAAVDGDCYADGISLAGTATTKVAPQDGLAALTHANSLKPAYELAGHTLANKLGSYDLVLKGNTVGTVAGSVTIRGVILPNG